MNKFKIEAGVSMFLLFFVINLVECIFAPITTMSVVTCLLGVILVPALWPTFFELHLGDDLSTTWSVRILSVLYGILVVALAVSAASGVEQFLYHTLGNEGLLLKELTDFRYLSKELALVGQLEHWPVLLKKWAGIVVAVLTAAFTELLFRGLVLQSNVSNGHTFKTSCIRQGVMFAVFSTTYISFLIVKNFMIHGSRDSIIIGTGAILVSLFCAFLMGYSLSILRFGIGSIWVCLVVSFGYELYIGFVHSGQYLPSILHCFTGLLHSCAFAGVVFLTALPWMKKLEDMS